jgi:hypothetical protein
MALLATLIFYLGNRKKSYFVRWHCTQALLSQFSLLLINSLAFWWTVSIVLDQCTLSNEYISGLGEDERGFLPQMKRIFTDC